MPLQRLGSLLSATDELIALTSMARRLRELQSLYSRSAPGELTDSSRVKSCKAGTLYIAADNAAVASKLKQMTPRLLALIRETEAQVTKIRIDVQVSGRGESCPYTPRKTALTSRVIAELQELSARVHNDGLKEALAKLADRHTSSDNSSDQDEALHGVKNHRDDKNHDDEIKRAPGPLEITRISGVEKKPNRNQDRE
jgi:hypothetical protein